MHRFTAHLAWIFLPASLFAGAVPEPSGKIAPWVMENTAGGGTAEILVVLRDQADLTAARKLPTKTEKGRYVYGQLRDIAGQDTGYQWDHPAIKPHYRGWNGLTSNHNYNWHDAIHDSVGNPCGNDAQAPCDDFGHGTHTIGTATGDDGGTNKIGVAPGAKWIGCRNMDQGDGTPARYIECFQWELAPTDLNGQNPDPTKSPDLTTNSWGCPPSEGCSADTLQSAVDAQRAAGIMPVVAAGNSGPSCSTVTDPPSLYDSSCTIGAFSSSGGTIAGFSSRGPVTYNAVT